MTRLRWMLVATIFGISLLACGDDGGGDGEGQGGFGGGGSGATGGSGGTGGADGKGGGGGDENVVRDTSGYDGLLAWSRGIRFGVHVWDLSNSQMLLDKPTSKLDDEDASAEFYGSPILSDDGSTLAYLLEHSFFLTARRAEVHVIDLETKAETPYPTDDLGADWVRNTIHPSLSADGRRVAVAETHAELEDFGGEMLPGAGTPLSIQVWDRTSGELIRVTDGDAKDTLPILSADGTRVLFVSDRDERNGDFYLADVEDGAAVERVSALTHPEIDRIRVEELPHTLAVSSDLRWVFFMAQGSEGAFPFLLDTTTGDVQRIDLGASPEAETTNIWSSLAMSRDGSMLAVTLSQLGEEQIVYRVVTAPRESLDEVKIVAEERLPCGNVSLSADGSQIAYIQSMETLVVDKTAAPDPRIVAGREEDRVMSLGARVTF